MPAAAYRRRSELHGHDRHAELGGDTLDGRPLGRTQDDPGAGHRSLLARRGSHRRPERASVGLFDDQRWSGGMSPGPNRRGHPRYLLDISGTRH